MKLEAVDRWVIGYAVCSSLTALLFAPDQSPFVVSHAFHAGAIVAAWLVARFLPPEGRWRPYVRWGYPLLLFGFFYLDTVNYIWLFFDHWFDPGLIAFETSVMGFNLTAELARIDRPWLLDFWMVGYFFYYLMPPLAAMVMIRQHRPELFRRMMIATSAAFFVSYAMFYFFPLEGPRYALSETLPPLEGLVFYPLVMAVQNSGSIHGGCMPSSHTAVAWVLTYYLYHACRPVGRAWVVISTMLSVGCIWGRFHYLTDVLVGLLIFVFAVWLTERYNRAGAPTGLVASPTLKGAA